MVRSIGVREAAGKTSKGLVEPFGSDGGERRSGMMMITCALALEDAAWAFDAESPTHARTATIPHARQYFVMAMNAKSLSAG